MQLGKQLKAILKSLLWFPADLLIVSSKRLQREIRNKVIAFPFLSSKFLPYQMEESWYLIEKRKSQKQENVELSVPPRSLWEGYADSPKAYLQCGFDDIANMRRILAADGFRFEKGQHILEFGCAGGRLLRYFVEEAKKSEFWGVDISAEHIVWCQQNLTPPFHFATTTTQPHLPFPDNYFDLIYAGSVFTHISDLADAWLLELKRQLKQGGRLYITIHDRHTIEIVKSNPQVHDLGRQLLEFDRVMAVTSSNFGVFVMERSTKSTQVFYDIDYFREKVARWFNLKAVREEACGYQTAILLQKL